MATTLNEVINTVVYNDLPSQDSPEKTAFYESGIVVQNSLLDAVASQPGFTCDLPYWRDLNEATAPNLSNATIAAVAVPDLLDQGHQIGRKAFLNQGWSVMDLASEIAMGAEKAMERIKARTDRYWTRQWQRRLIATANGLLVDNVAANNSDMVINVAAALNGNVNAGTVFSRSNFTSAAFTLGDAVDGIGLIAVHSVVYKRMIDNGDIIMIRPQDGTMDVPTYLGKRVIVDDSMPVVPAAGPGAGDAAPQYTSILFGTGAFGYGDGLPEVPVEVERSARTGNGAGQETLWVRKTWILHPFGYQAVGVPAAVSYSIAELQLAATWTRVVPRKHVPIAFLVTNG
jgi:hypothetical protein